VEFLDVRMLDPDALKHLGRLTSLKFLHITFPKAFSSAGLERSMFCNLRTAHLVDKEDMTAMIAMVRTWKNPEIGTFRAEVGRPREMARIAELYQVLATHCVPDALQSLAVEFYGVTPNPIIPHPGHFFTPLFTFTHLRIVEIRVPGCYELNDADIYDMVRAWPFIEELRLEEYSRRNDDPPQCTMLSLRVLAQHCPHLRKLTMSLDTLRMPQAAIGLEEQVVQDVLVSLDASLSPISDPASVARFIFGIFPSVKDIWSGLNSDRDDGAHAEHRRHWGTVRHIVQRRRGGRYR
jgi:hypothetical protein